MPFSILLIGDDFQGHFAHYGHFVSRFRWTQRWLLNNRRPGLRIRSRHVSGLKAK